jgi:capsular polysaccharide biosynthesis protein
MNLLYSLTRNIILKLKSFLIEWKSINLENNITQVIQNAAINVDSGVFYSNKAPIVQSFFGKNKMLKLIKIGFKYSILEKSVFTVIQHGPWENYYHWYIDSVSRVWGLHDQCSVSYSTVKLYLSKDLNLLELDFLKALLPPNVKIVQVAKGTLVRGHKAIYLPFLSRDCSGSLPSDFLKFYLDKAVSFFNLQKMKNAPLKLFVSRRSANKRRIINEAELIELIESAGYLVVECDNLNIGEQASLFYNANKILAQHGAALTNLLYVESAEIVEIFHSANTHLNHYRDLCLQKRLQYTSVYLNGPDKDSDIYLDLKIIKALL